MSEACLASNVDHRFLVWMSSSICSLSSSGRSVLLGRLPLLHRLELAREALVGLGIGADLGHGLPKRGAARCIVVRKIAPLEAAAQDDDCVFVKVTTLAERDAVGRANAIVLD